MSSYEVGIDVSKWQESVNWPFFLAAGGSYAFVRILNGIWEDVKFESHWKMSKIAGVKRGLYIYYLDDCDPKQMARRAFDVATRCGDLGDYPPTLDIEETGNNQIRAARVRACLQELERLFGRIPMVYTRATVFDKVSKSRTLFGRYPLWVAHYTLRGWQADHLNKVKGYPPTVPAAFELFQVWQVSDQCPGYIYGVSSHTVDVDLANGESLQALENGAGVVIPPAVDFDQGVVLLHGLSLRSLPTNKGKTWIATLNAGEVVRLYGLFEESEIVNGVNVVNVWAHIERSDHRVGWAAVSHHTLGSPGLELRYHDSQG